MTLLKVIGNKLQVILCFAYMTNTAAMDFGSTKLKTVKLRKEEFHYKIFFLIELLTST